MRGAFALLLTACYSPDLGRRDVPWWDEAWQARAPLRIANEGGAPLPAGFEVAWSVALDAWDVPPYDDVRLVRWDGAASREKARVIDLEGEPHRVWFGLDQELGPSSVNDDYWVYWQSETAGPAPAEDAEVFTLLFDSFDDGTLDPIRWQAEVDGTAVPEMGALLLDPGESVRSLSTWAPGHAVDFALAMSGPAFRSWGGFQRTADFNNAIPWMLWTEWDPTGELFPDSQLVSDGGLRDFGPAVLPGTATHLYTIEREPGLIRFLYDGALQYERALSIPFTDALQVRFRNGDASARMTVSWLRVRHAADPAPVVSLGAEEPRGAEL